MELLLSSMPQSQHLLHEPFKGEGIVCLSMDHIMSVAIAVVVATAVIANTVATIVAVVVAVKIMIAVAMAVPWLWLQLSPLQT